MRVVNAEVPGAIHRAAEWHFHIAEAIADRNPVAAEAAMRLHLNQVRGELERQLNAESTDRKVAS